MPYTQEHKRADADAHRRAPGGCFSRNGFAEVSIDEIMGEAGLTRGGFYKHFSAKEDVYQAAVLNSPAPGSPRRGRPVTSTPSAQGHRALARMIVEAYLSRDHFDTATAPAR